VGGASTPIDAEALPDPPSVLVNDAVFCSVEPHVPASVALTTCTCVLAPAASVDWL
jgi:hypothetical protein